MRYKKPAGNVPDDDPDVVVRVENVHHSYRRGVHALRGVDLTLRRGEFVAFVGRNGSGKTTLVKHFNGMLRPTNSGGHVYVRLPDRGLTETRTMRLHKLAPVVGYVFQNPDNQIFHDTCAEELAFGLKNIAVPEEELDERIDNALAEIGLAGKGAANPVRLSRGERQRLAIAATLVMRPDVLVVDEPTTGQDRHESRLILELLASYRQQGRTVVVVSHDMALVARYASRVIALRDGRTLADGPPRDVFSVPEVLATTNIKPPQITLFGMRVGLPGLLTVEEAVEQIHRLGRPGVHDAPAPGR